MPRSKPAPRGRLPVAVAFLLLVPCGSMRAQTLPAEWIRAHVGGVRYHHAMAYDAARQRVVMFGGFGPWAASVPPTQEWDGTRWTQRSPANSPSLRRRPAMAYDAARRRVVLFGGDTGLTSQALGDTWEWDGSDWTQRSPAARPSPRSFHAMAYDAARQRVVLFGGRDPSVTVGYFGDTWEWDGTTWSLRSPPVNAPPRAAHAMAYDSTRQRVVMFGGASPSGDLNDTWEWDGATWQGKPSASPPGKRTQHAMAFDSVRGRVVMFGGYYSYNELADTWEWDGTSWSLRPSPVSPPARMGHAVAYDAARQRLVLFAGTTSLAPMSDTWEWDGNTWSHSAAGSPGLSATGMSYDAARQRAVLFGGYAIDFSTGGPTLLDETWEYDGDRWLQRSPSVKPRARAGAKLAYDSVRQRTVLHGGYLYPGGLNDTAEWDGNNWMLLAPSTSPGPRNDYAIAYDAARQRTVLFGGAISSTSTFFSDTWTWDGSTWTKLSPPTDPGPRGGHAMAYDPLRQRVVLFGGQATYVALSDTWEWDGSNWTQRGAYGPPGRRLGAMAYDDVRKRIVMIGGHNGSSMGDSWEWDGTSWILRSWMTAVGARDGAAITYDAARQRMLLFHWGESWLCSLQPAGSQPSGNACAGSTGMPVLTTGVPLLGNGAFTLQLGNALPAAACLFGLSAASQTLQIGGCTLYLQEPIVTLPATTDAAGAAVSPALAIPFDPILRGVTLHTQAFVADPLGAMPGAAFTGMRTLVLGD